MIKNSIIILICFFMFLFSCKDKKQENKNDLFEISNASQQNQMPKILSQKVDLLSTVLSQLDLNKSKIKNEFVALKEIPNNLNETIVVIPEIVEEDEHYFELNSHILIIDSNTGKIKSKYFESSKTNEWFSDAIQLVEISIDTAPYTISNKNRAFGIKVRYVGSSRANPYENQTISLFIVENQTLKQLLKNFTIKQYKGEWNTDCEGEFMEQNKIIILSKNKTNGFYDLIIKNTISNSRAFLDKNKECQEEEIISKKTQILKYKNDIYK